jgi:hypothetical protein
VCLKNYQTSKSTSTKVSFFVWGGDEVCYHGYQDSWTRQIEIGGATMSRLTQPKDTGQKAHNRGGLEIIVDKTYKLGK